MLVCWRHSPRQRPHFDDIVKNLAKEIDESFKDNAFVFSAEYEALQAAHAKAAEEAGVTYVEDDGEETPLTASREHMAWEVSDLSLDDQPPASVSIEKDNVVNELLEPRNRKGRTSMNGGCGEPSRPEDRPIQRPADIRRSHPSTHSSLSTCSQPPPGGQNYSSGGSTYSGGGSKDSSKSSNSSYQHLNGLANGHIPQNYMPRHAEC